MGWIRTQGGQGANVCFLPAPEGLLLALSRPHGLFISRGLAADHNRIED